MKTLIDLFFTFCRIGGLTFGGGYAMLPMIQKEIVEEKKWATEEEVLDYYAVGQCTPGIIAVNTATFIGYKVQGIIGAIVATLGVVFPSYIIIMLDRKTLTIDLASFLSKIILVHPYWLMGHTHYRLYSSSIILIIAHTHSALISRC